jgi:hypothetical protein
MEKTTPRRVKFNINAAFPSSYNCIGLGIHICDEANAFVLVKTDWIEPKCEIYIGEVLGFWFSLCFSMGS